METIKIQMTKFFYIFVFFVGIKPSFAQTKNTVYLTYGFSNATPVYNKQLEGTSAYDANGASAFGVRFIAKSSKIITFETGIDFISCKFNLEPVFYPAIEMTPRPETMSLLSVPVYANLSFLKYFFINGGALLDFEISKKYENTVKDQTGVGFGLGLGARCNFKRVSILLNPFVQRHGILAINSNGANQSLLNIGGRVGLGYLF